MSVAMFPLKWEEYNHCSHVAVVVVELTLVAVAAAVVDLDSVVTAAVWIQSSYSSGSVIASRNRIVSNPCK